MRRPSRDERKPADEGNQPSPPELPDITLGRDQIDENRLHPIGIPGFNLLEPSLELVDYKDWFLQPIQGNIHELGGIDITVSEDGCMVCVSVRGSLGWLEATEGNGAGFCYIKPSCRKKEPPPPKPPSYPSEFGPEDVKKPIPPPFPPTPLTPGAHIIEFRPKDGLLLKTLICTNSVRTNIPKWGANYRRYDIVIGKNGGTLSSLSSSYQSVVNNDYRCPPDYKWRDGTKYSEQNVHVMLDGQYLEFYGLMTARYEAGGNSPVESVFEYWVHELYLDGELLDNGDNNNNEPNNDDNEQPPPKPPENDKMACCRNQTNSDALLRKIAKCVGTQQLPATMPKSFNRKVGGTTRITSIPEFQQWMAIQFSDLIGEFPKKIKIKDANLLEDGDQGLEIELPNLSEAIADMYGTGVRATAVNEVLMAFATRMAVEICSVKSATLVGQSYSKATALALGYKFEEEKELIPFGFNFTANAEKLEDFLESSEKKITVWKCKEPSSAWEYLERLMYVASLLKAKTLRKESSTLSDTIKRIKDLGLLGEDKLDDFINKLKESGFYDVDDTMRRPDVEKK